MVDCWTGTTHELLLLLLCAAPSASGCEWFGRDDDDESESATATATAGESSCCSDDDDENKADKGLTMHSPWLPVESESERRARGTKSGRVSLPCPASLSPELTTSRQG